MAKKKIDFKEYESQDFSDWEIKDTPDKTIEIGGKKFLLRQPKDSDVIVRVLAETDQAKVIKNLCQAVVAAPKLGKLWDRLGAVWKMRLGNEVSEFLGLTEDFLDTQIGR